MGVWGRTSPSPLIPRILEAVACMADIEWRCGGGGGGEKAGGFEDPPLPFSPSPLLLRPQDKRVSWAGLRKEVFVVIILTKLERIAPVSTNIDGIVAWKLTFQEKKKLIKNNINNLRKKTNCRPSSLHSRIATSDDRKYVWGSQSTILESFKFEDRTRTSMRLNLKVLLVFSKKDTQESFILLFYTKKS